MSDLDSPERPTEALPTNLEQLQSIKEKLRKGVSAQAEGDLGELQSTLERMGKEQGAFDSEAIQNELKQLVTVVESFNKSKKREKVQELISSAHKDLDALQSRVEQNPNYQAPASAEKPNSEKEEDSKPKEDKGFLGKYIYSPIAGAFGFSGEYIGKSVSWLGEKVKNGVGNMMNFSESAKNFFAFNVGPTLRDLQDLPFLKYIPGSSFLLSLVMPARTDLALALKNQGFSRIKLGSGERIKNILADPLFAGESREAQLTKLAVIARRNVDKVEKGRAAVSYKELVSAANQMREGKTEESETKQQQNETPQEPAAAERPDATLLPKESISFESFKNGVEVGEFGKVTIIPETATIIVNDKEWRLVGKEGDAMRAKLDITEALWDGNIFVFSVRGILPKTGWLDSIKNFVGSVSGLNDSKQELPKNKTINLLKHLSESSDPYKIKTKEGKYAGVDIVLQN